MNVYDFDNTIYNGDSTVDFYFYCLRQKPSLVRFVPGQIWKFALYRMHRISKEEFKESVYRMMIRMDALPRQVCAFWDDHERKIKPFYLRQRRRDDVVISASPDFLIIPVCQRLQITGLASRIDLRTGKHSDGKNCYGARKVERFYECFPQGKIDEFYSDSRSDEPLRNLARQAWLVQKNQLIPWK